jgi:hypothetical protein
LDKRQIEPGSILVSQGLFRLYSGLFNEILPLSIDL